ncbi:hypothetical protein J6590_056659, partial [Homalodisca vitripennis]
VNDGTVRSTSVTHCDRTGGRTGDRTGGRQYFIQSMLTMDLNATIHSHSSGALISLTLH